MKTNSIVRTVISLMSALIIYFALILVLVSVEKSSDGGSITSIRDGLWYSIVTLTTVGYGDLYPTSTSGRIVGYIFVLSSLGILGYLIGKVSSVIYEIKENRKLGYGGTSFRRHIVVIGWNSFSQSVVDQLVGVRARVAIVTDNRNDVDLIRENYSKNQVYVLFSHYSNFDLIEKANINQSEMVFINLDDDVDKLVYILNCKKHFADVVKYAVLPQNSDLKGTFIGAEPEFVLSRDELASKIVASYIFEPDVAEFEEDLLSSAESDDDYDIKEYKVISSNPYLEQNYNDVYFNIKSDYNCLLLGIAKIEGDRRVLHKNPDSETLKIELNDYLILIVNGGSAYRVSQAFGVGEGSLN